MDILPSEEFPKQSQAEQEPKEILLNKTVARMLGRGLEQIFNEGGAKTISNALESLSKIGECRKYAEMMGSALAFLQDIVNKLQTEETRLTREKEGGQWNFKFSSESSEKEPAEKFQASELIIDKDLSEKLMSAIGNVINNKLTGIIGLSGLMDEDFGDNSIGKKTNLINTHAQKIYKNISSATKVGNSIRLFTDDNGKTTISPIP